MATQPPPANYSDLYQDPAKPKKHPLEGLPENYRSSPQPQQGKAISWLDTFYKYRKQFGLLFLVIGFVCGFGGVYISPVFYGLCLFCLVVGGVLFAADELLKGGG